MCLLCVTVQHYERVSFFFLRKCCPLWWATAIDIHILQRLKVESENIFRANNINCNRHSHYGCFWLACFVCYLFISIFLNLGCSSQLEKETFELLWKLHQTAAPQIFRDKFCKMKRLIYGIGHGAFMGVYTLLRSAHKTCKSPAFF